MKKKETVSKDIASISSTDLRWMARAIEQERHSVGVSSPNPAVGCVLVQGEETLVGEGFHEYDKRDHAEIAALKRAGEKARGATAYVTLEPCSHQGRTGPCADALIAARVGRVVVATGDPNPSVSGRGIEKLRAAGIAVTSGVLQGEAREMNHGFAKYIQTKLPFLTLKAGVSLDGRIAPAPTAEPAGQPIYITSEESRAVVQEMRHASDALITGINTVLTDDPQLTDRSGLPRRRPLLRVVLDSALRLPLESKLVQTAKDDLLVFHSAENPERQRALEERGVRVEHIETASAEGRISLKSVLTRLGEMQICSAMLEAGSKLNHAALAEQVVDKLCLFYAPTFLGAHGVPLLSGGERIQIDPERIRWKQVANDLCFEAYLRDYWVK